MTEYLFDTSALSVLAPRRAEVSDALKARFIELEPRIYLSVISIAEVQQGIAKLRRSGALQRHEEMSSWLSDVIAVFEERTISVDGAIAVAAGELADAAMGAGHVVEFGDLYIAATAKVHGLTVLTHNVKHFATIGVAYVDPLVTLPR